MELIEDSQYIILHLTLVRALGKKSTDHVFLYNHNNDA